MLFIFVAGFLLCLQCYLQLDFHLRNLCCLCGFCFGVELFDLLLIMCYVVLLILIVCIGLFVWWFIVGVCKLLGCWLTVGLDVAVNS